MTPIEQLQPAAVETTPEQDFRAKLRWYLDEQIGDMAYHMQLVRGVVNNLLMGGSIDTEMLKDLRYSMRSFQKADAMMDGDLDLMPEIEASAPWLKAALGAPHEGDCVACPCSCTRCFAETLYDLPSTVTWKGKHEGWALYNQAKTDIVPMQY
jgi:hypothetical protein